MAETYVRISSKLIRQKYAELSGIAVKVLGVLLTYRNSRTGLCCPSEETIAEVLHANERTIRRAIGELAKAEIVAIQRGKHNSYTINPEYAKHEHVNRTKLSACGYCPYKREPDKIVL